MKVQCSILESPVRQVKETPTRSALWGNQDSPQLDYRAASVGFKVPLIQSMQYQNADNPPIAGYITPATPYDSAYRQLIQNFQTMAAVYASPDYPTYPYGISPYSAQMTVTGAGMVPSLTGFPFSLQYSQTPPVVWGGYFGDSPSTTLNGDTGLQFNAGTESLSLQLSNPVDYAGLWNRIQNDFLSLVLSADPAHWADGLPQYSYDFGGPQSTGAFQQYPTALAMPVDYWIAASGWNILFSSAWRSQVRYLGATPLFFWLGRSRHQVNFAFKKGDWVRTDELISMGFLYPVNGVAIYEIPFPPSNPYPLAKIGNGPVVQDLYFFAVINPPKGSFGTIYA